MSKTFQRLLWETGVDDCFNANVKPSNHFTNTLFDVTFPHKNLKLLSLFFIDNKKQNKRQIAC